MNKLPRNKLQGILQTEKFVHSSASTTQQAVRYSQSLNKASIKIRFLAKAIDTFIGMLVFSFLVLMISASGNMANLMDSLLLGLTILIFFQTFYVIFNTFLTSRFGGSIGKLASGIKVINEKGELLSFKRALFRQTVGYSVSALFFGAGYFWIIKDEENQAWHDMTVGSKVVSEAKYALATSVITLTALIVIGALTFSTSIQNFNKNKHVYLNILQDAAREIQRTINQVEK